MFFSLPLPRNLFEKVQNNLPGKAPVQYGNKGGSFSGYISSLQATHETNDQQERAAPSVSALYKFLKNVFFFFFASIKCRMQIFAGFEFLQQTIRKIVYNFLQQTIRKNVYNSHIRRFPAVVCTPTATYLHEKHMSHVQYFLNPTQRTPSKHLIHECDRTTLVNIHIYIYI